MIKLNLISGFEIRASKNGKNYLCSISEKSSQSNIKPVQSIYQIQSFTHSHNIGSYFHYNDIKSLRLAESLIHKFTRGDCTTAYICEPKKPMRVRMHQHIVNILNNKINIKLILKKLLIWIYEKDMLHSQIISKFYQSGFDLWLELKNLCKF